MQQFHILHYYCPIFRALCNALMQRVTTFWGFAFPGKERMERRLVYIGSSSPWNIIHHMVVVLKVFQIAQKKKIKKITQDHYCWCWKKNWAMITHDLEWLEMIADHMIKLHLASYSTVGFFASFMEDILQNLLKYNYIQFHSLPFSMRRIEVVPCLSNYLDTNMKAESLILSYFRKVCVRYKNICIHNYIILSIT